MKRSLGTLTGALLVSLAAASAPRDDVVKGLPLVPTACRTFSRSDKVSVFLQVSQGTARKDAIQPVAVRLPLAAGELPPGRSLLTLEASAGDLRGERLVRFEIR